MRRNGPSVAENLFTPAFRGTGGIAARSKAGSIRSTVCMTGVAKKTVMRVLVEVGEICADYQDRAYSATLPRGGSNSMGCGRGFIAKQHISKQPTTRWPFALT